jgi:hypothetical protein
VRLILLREWDPLCVKLKGQYDEDIEDEYDGYAREIATMKSRNVSSDEIFAYLKWAVCENMGMSVFDDAGARRAAELIAGPKPINE